MRREFTIKGFKFGVVNKFGYGAKYDLMMFNSDYNAWVRVGSCDTIASGRDIAEQHVDNLLSCD